MSERVDEYEISAMKGGKGSPRKKNRNGKKSAEVSTKLDNCVKKAEASEPQLTLVNGTSESGYSLNNDNSLEKKESVNLKSADECSPENNVEINSIESNVSVEDDCKTNHEEKDNLDEKSVNEALDELAASLEAKVTVDDPIEYVSYHSELQMTEIMRLIQRDLSEPYSIYTYRYFIHNWPKLCFLAVRGGRCVGAVVCKLDLHRKVVKRGYIAMLAVDQNYRKQKIGSRLVRQAIQVMVEDDADEVVLETEITNKPALRLYENLGFVRDKRLFRYYLNGVDALRLKLWLR